MKEMDGWSGALSEESIESVHRQFNEIGIHRRFITRKEKQLEFLLKVSNLY